MSARFAAAGCRWLVAFGLALLAAVAQAGIDLDSVTQLRLLSSGVKPPVAIGGTQFRVAVFAYDDPDRTQLGEAVGALARHELLLGARVRSLGVLRFSNPMAPEAEAVDPGAGYFDRVDRLVDAQKATLAVWGTVRREGEQFVIDTWLQVPDATVRQGLSVQLALPAAMGRAPLVGRIGHDRVHLQRLTLTAGAAEAVRLAAEKVGELRAAPDPNTPVARQLPKEAVYAVRELRLPWALLSSREGSGWGRSAAFHCTESCAPLLEGPRFVSRLLAFIERRQPIERGVGLLPDAGVFVEQAQALALLEARGGDPLRGPRQAQEALRPLAAPRAGVQPPALADSANLLLLVRMSQALRESALERGGGPYDSWQVAPARIAPIAFDAAEALQHEPNHPELLHNLAVLFALAGQPARSDLARRLLEQSRASTRGPAVIR
jgi:hypothetical protein